MTDPLWSETCWSTSKYFIILIVSTYYILCISWTIKCLITIDARCKHEDSPPTFPRICGSGFLSLCPLAVLITAVLRWKLLWNIGEIRLIKGKCQYLEKNFSHCHFLYHVSHINWSTIETGPSEWKLCNKSHWSEKNIYSIGRFYPFYRPRRPLEWVELYLQSF